MSTYLERLREMQAIEQRRREAAAAIALAKRILDNKTCPCGFCVSRRELHPVTLQAGSNLCVCGHPVGHASHPA